MKFLMTVTLFFLLVLTLGTSNVQYNKRPCMPARNRRGYKHFQERHILPAGFDTNSKDAFEAHIGKIRRCNIPVQSFFLKKDQEKVEQICNGEGHTLGKGYDGNVCMSDVEIQVYQVNVMKKVNPRTCEVTSIDSACERVAVACDKIGHNCLPVHFQKKKNKEDKPDNHSPTCKPSKRIVS